jgi:hypothetical protein
MTESCWPRWISRRNPLLRVASGFVRMQRRRSNRITLTLMGVSSVFLASCDNRPTPEQRREWLADQELQAGKTLSTDDRQKADQEYGNWTAEQKNTREKESRQNGYREDSGLPWWVYWMIFNSLVSPNNRYTGYRPSYFYSRSFQDYQNQLRRAQNSSGSYRSGGFAGGYSGSGSSSRDGGVTRDGFGSRGAGGAGE